MHRKIQHSARLVKTSLHCFGQYRELGFPLRVTEFWRIQDDITRSNLRKLLYSGRPIYEPTEFNLHQFADPSRVTRLVKDWYSLN